MNSAQISIFHNIGRRSNIPTYSAILDKSFLKNIPQTIVQRYECQLISVFIYERNGNRIRDLLSSILLWSVQINAVQSVNDVFRLEMVNASRVLACSAERIFWIHQNIHQLRADSILSTFNNKQYSKSLFSADLNSANFKDTKVGLLLSDSNS